MSEAADVVNVAHRQALLLTPFVQRCEKQHRMNIPRAVTRARRSSHGLARRWQMTYAFLRPIERL